MAQYYRIEIDQPATKTVGSKSWVWTPDSEIVESADIDLSKEGKRISSASVTIYDPRKNLQMWPIANALPDPTFSDIPFRIYLSKPGEGQSASKLVFDGKLTSIQPSWPGPSNVTLVAHDRSIDLRKAAKYRTLRKQTGTQIVQTIAADYGLTVNLSELTTAVTTQRLAEMALSGVGRGTFSEWDQITRALAVDGLELYTVGKVLHIRQSAQTAYPHSFQPDDGIVEDFKPTINHVGVPGDGGNSKTPGAPSYSASDPVQGAAQGDLKKETDAAKADATTHRTVPQGPDASKTNAAHTESMGTNKLPAVQRHKRKDESTLTVRALPDLGLQHTVTMAGWGGKFDGTWHPITIKHMITGHAAAVTTVHMSRQPSGASQKAVGISAPSNSVL